MTVVVFAGPTVDSATIRAYIDAEVRGPAAFGDVYRAAQDKPIAIVIIDGYFDRTASVWHKEILWAMAEGVHVFGACSMGALRAAELADFGMEGVGEVFASYRSGELEDDDEVAVVHGHAETGYLAGSEAMVNMRVTLRAASDSGVIDASTGGTLERLAKALFYPDRSYARLLELAAKSQVPSTQIGALKAWLPSGRVDRKRADALLLLQHLRDWLAKSPQRKRVTFRFQATDAWHQAVRLFEARVETYRRPDSSDLLELEEELKIAGCYAVAWHAAAVRGISLRECAQRGLQPDFHAVRAAVEQLRIALGLFDSEGLTAWQALGDLTDKTAVKFFQDQARLLWMRPLLEELARRHLTDHLKSTGEYGALVARGRNKRRLLQAHGGITPQLSELSISESALWEWYFSQRLRRGAPHDIDAYARAAGFRDRDELQAAVVREMLCFTDSERQNAAVTRPASLSLVEPNL